jgi:hypothetical protein
MHTLPMRRWPALLALLALVACSTMQTEPVPELTFVHQSPIGLNVASLDITSAYRAPMQPPHVEDKLPVPPEEALKRWARERLRALGSSGTARFTVLTAAVTEEQLPKTKGFLGAFEIEPGARYTATVEAQLEIFDAEGKRLGLTSARTTRARILEQGWTREERERFWYDLTKAVMDDFNEQMERSIRQYLNPWVL